MKAGYFFDALLGQCIAMNFDFGRAMTMRHAAEVLATPQPVTGDDFSHAMKSDKPAIDDDMLPEGVSGGDGKYFADCCCCERECDVTEFMGERDGIDFTRWYGGCSDRCCP